MAHPQSGATALVEGTRDEEVVSVAEDERAFGRYTLRYEIASGGMASVFLARARGPGGFDRACAIKRVHPHLAKKTDFVDMFLDEARLSARIHHPNVCSTFDFGEVEGTYFMAMEYLAGQPLSKLLGALQQRPDVARSPRWQVLAAKIVADACEGLHAAHELRDDAGRPMNVVHRDVTPHNVFVTYDGAVKVVDFGVAFAEGRLHHTETGTIKGKLGYMAPEQVQGGELDRRVDLWALGVCLWELLCVRRLFRRRSEVEVISAVARDPIPRPSDVVPTIHGALDGIALRALSRDPAGRPASARAMARELNAFVGASGISAGLADVSELMEELFAEDHARKAGLVASMLQSGSSPLVGIPASDTRSGARPRTSEPPTTADAVPATRTGPGPAIVAATAEPVATARRALPWAIAAILALTAVGAAALGAVLAAQGPVADANVPVPVPVPAPVPVPVPEAARTLAVEAEPVAAEPLAVPRGIDPPPIEPEASAPAPIEAEPRPATARAPRRAPAEPAPRGTVNVATRGGWADIVLRGESLGRTPRSLQLPEGRHVLELRPQGRTPGVRTPVVVRAGETERVVVDLP